MNSQPVAGSNQATRKLTNAARTDTRPLAAPAAFSHRAPGAIFGDAFIFKSLISSDEGQNQYLVGQLDNPQNQYILACPNAGCGAIFSPKASSMEKFCTDCGTTLGERVQELALVESPTPVPANIVYLAEKSLSHSFLRAPVAAFEERLGESLRFSQVSPVVIPLEGKAQAEKAIKWGAGLARGLDLLHDNGVAFGGRVELNCFGLAEERAVWANFTNCVLYPEGPVPDRSADLRALARIVFYWLTGKTQLDPDPKLPPAVRQIFEFALAPPGFTNGQGFAAALEGLHEQFRVPQVVDFHLGRRTNVGMVRTLNEDSVLAVEINRICQSVSQPLGVFVIADGMGGHAAGEVASCSIVNTIAQKALAELIPAQIAQTPGADRKQWLGKAVEAANKGVFDLRKSSGTDMGSTLVSAVVDGNIAHVAHVGDSRAYVVNSRGIRQITTDHSLVERLIATKQITREEARHHPQRNVIYRTIGDKTNVEVELSTHTLEVGDHLLLCSDGLSGMVEDRTIHKIVLEAASPQAACDALIAAACAAGGEDNVSAIIVKIVQS